MDLAGRDLTEYVMKILTEQRYIFTTPAEHKIGLNVKEKLCYIALDFDTEMEEASKSSDKEKTCKHPDDNIITVGSKRFHCPEVRLSPTSLARWASFALRILSRRIR